MAVVTGTPWRSWLTGPDTRALETAEQLLVDSGRFKWEGLDP